MKKKDDCSLKLWILHLCLNKPSFQIVPRKHFCHGYIVLCLAAKMFPGDKMPILRKLTFGSHFWVPMPNVMAKKGENYRNPLLIYKIVLTVFKPINSFIGPY